MKCPACGAAIPARRLAPPRRPLTVDDIDWDRLPHDDARAIVARWLTGEHADDLAAEASYSPSAIRMWVSRARIRPTQTLAGTRATTP